MSFDINLISEKEIENLYQKIGEKKGEIKSYSREKLLFEKERCEQILNRNIPMCISNYTKHLLQLTDKEKIERQLIRLNLECYWKIFNLEYLKSIEEQLTEKK